MEGSVRERLLELAEEDYRRFSASLLPNVEHILGVRLPALRILAKQLAKGDWRTYLEQADDTYFEEVMLQGMTIGYVKAEFQEIQSYIARFVPKINNWSVCDSFCSGLKLQQADKHEVWEWVRPYVLMRSEYEIRFGVVMLLNYFMEERYLPEVLLLLDQVRHDGYYAKMAVAWAVSIAYIKQPALTEGYLLNNSLDDFTYNKALQKITESLRIERETKQWIRSLKRK
ncbi:DNA alkylation repair protein [Paenibacillus doosanensis]|uniref:DNA alkylation repair enzyme n=1 Tax=Paenibacillus konkukensis TaxID=2020716 RepID=A0ABY4RHU8_9BACL|nr:MULTISPECIES: DNA alkylation repair protein [Paenibacillus]MCS7463802.1 DNA alkylation repair protein [Paenibacillus doosanensis]UQZ81355.1 DNA alkylation repair enzyme [Paenibacillus konkukensis]